MLTVSPAIDYTRSLEQGRRAAERKAETYRVDAERCVALQRENQELREEVQRLRQLGQQNTSMPNLGLHYHHPPSATAPRPASPASRPTLPMPAPSTAMQGIQFSN